MLKVKQCRTYKTLYVPKYLSKDSVKNLAFQTQTQRLVRPAFEEIKKGNYMTMEEFRIWFDELCAESE